MNKLCAGTDPLSYSFLDSFSADLRRELTILDQALAQLKAEEAASVQAQIAGMRRGVSPNAYAEAFAGIAVRGKDMEDRRRLLNASLLRSSDPKARKDNPQTVLMSRAVEDALTALTNEDVTGPQKRLLLGRLQTGSSLTKKEPTCFSPPAFSRGAEGEDGSNSTGSPHTFHTTCIARPA